MREQCRVPERGEQHACGERHVAGAGGEGCEHDQRIREAVLKRAVGHPYGVESRPLGVGAEVDQRGDSVAVLAAGLERRE